MKNIKIISLVLVLSIISSSIFSAPPIVKSGEVTCSTTPYYLCGAASVTAAFLGYKCFKMNREIKKMRAVIAGLKQSEPADSQAATK